MNTTDEDEIRITGTVSLEFHHLPGECRQWPGEEIEARLIAVAEEDNAVSHIFIRANLGTDLRI